MCGQRCTVLVIELKKAQTAVLYNLGSGSWLAWADDTVAHYAAIHCSKWRTVGPAVQHTDITPPQSAH